MKNQIKILIAICIAILSVAGYFVYKQYNSIKIQTQIQQIQQNQQQIIQNNVNVADWKTYKN